MILSLVYVHNPHLDALKEDFLYHFSLGTGTHNLPEMFGDVKVITFLYYVLRFKEIVNFVAIETKLGVAVAESHSQHVI